MRVVLFTLLATSAAAGCAADEAQSNATSATHVTSTAGPTMPTTTTLPSGPSAGCERESAAAPGRTDETLTSGGVERIYELTVPASYDGTAPLPVVLGLHALTVSHKFVPGMSGFGDMAAEHDFIAVAPSGLINGTTPYWNAAPVADNSDVTFIADLLDHLGDTLCIDTGRVFSMGMSNGAQMSSLLACTMPDRIAGIGPIAGVEFLEPCDGPPVPVIAFHGTADPIVKYEGGGLNATTIAAQQRYGGEMPEGMPEPLGVEESMQRWAEHNGCDPEAIDEKISEEVTHRHWEGCVAVTELYRVEGGGHTWPGRPVAGFEDSFGPTTVDIDATQLLFDLWFAER